MWVLAGYVIYSPMIKCKLIDANCNSFDNIIKVGNCGEARAATIWSTLVANANIPKLLPFLWNICWVRT